MPHTNRKKKPNAGSIPASETKKPMVIHTKRKEIQDEEGWTHVIDKPSRPTATTKNSNGLEGGDFKIGEVWYVNRTLEELQKEVEYWGKGWRESTASKELKELLEKEEKEGKRRKVEDIIVLGLGSLQLARREGRRASATQLAALQTMIELIFPGEAKPKVVCQDPGFSALDKEFLTGLGYEVVDDPEAFGRIQEGSLVYALHCYKEVYVKALSGANPAIFVGTELGMFESLDSPKIGEENITKVEDTLSDYTVLAFPQLRFDFSDTKIYWRPNTVAPATSDNTIDPINLSTLPDPEIQSAITTDTTGTSEPIIADELSST